MDIDHELKQTLEQLLKLCRDFGIQPRLIGGLAVRGFARRKRYTHDIDLASSRFDKPNLVTILKQMGFEYQDQSQFEGVKASKRIGNKTVEIHIAIDRLWDMVSNRTYTPSSDSAEVPIDEAGDLLAPAVSANKQVACPKCRSTVALAVNGNTLETPLICQACGQTFSPHFYCPEVNSSSRHVFTASRLYVDNMGAIYTFCPDHTFTTYALTADSKPRPKRSPFQSIARFFDSLIFRLSLTIEGLRWRLVSRR